MRILFDFVYSIQTPGVRSVVLYCSCLSGNIQKLLHPGDRGAQHKGRGQAEHVWAGELEPPWLWMESHASCNIDLDTAYSLRVDDGETGRKKITVYQRTVWAVPLLWVARYISSIEHNSDDDNCWASSGANGKVSLRFFCSQKLEILGSLFYGCQLGPKKAKHFLKLFGRSFYRETMKVWMVHNILIYILLDVHANQQKYYITP